MKQLKLEAGQSLILLSGGGQVAIWVSTKKGIFHRNAGLSFDIPQNLNAADGSFLRFVRRQATKNKLVVRRVKNLNQMLDVVKKETG